MKNYFSNHYAKMQGIDRNSENSIRDWYKSSIPAYKVELAPYMEYLNGKSILEIGCGIGGLLNYFKTIGNESFLGIDVSEEQVKICKEFVTDNVINAEALKFLNTNKIKFDCIVLFDLIEHIKKEEIIPLLELVHNALNKNGKVLIRTPNMSSLFANHSRYIDFTHETGFTLESLMQVLRESDFNIVKYTNSAIGRKRILLLNGIYWILAKLYSIKKPSIVSANIIILVEK